MSGEWDVDCAIVGGGPGGLVSALYLRRFKRSAVVINAGSPRAAWIPRTHNLFGFPRGISGQALLRRLNRHVNKLDTNRIHGSAVVKKHGHGFEVSVDGAVIKARKIILATGIEDGQPEIPNLNDLRVRGLLRYCSICDGFDFRDQVITVLAHNDAGIQKALFLRHFSKKIHIVLPEEMNVAPIRIKELREGRIKLHRGKVVALGPSASPKGIFTALSGGKTLWSRVVYPMLGCVVRDSSFQNMRGLSRTKAGFLIITTEQRLSVPGMFGVGDCVNQVGQIAIAAGQAAVAATTIHNDLYDF